MRVTGDVITGLPPILSRLSGDFGSLGHDPPRALALAASTVRTWRGKVKPDARKVLDAVLDDYGVARALAPTQLREALDMLAPSRASKDDLDKIREAAWNRRTLIEGFLLALTGSDRTTKDRAVAMSVSVLGVKPSGPKEATSLLEVALARDRLILEATSAKRKRLVEAPALGTTATPVKAPKAAGRDGKAVKDPNFEKQHPRTAKGRVGGGTFSLKKGTGMGDQQPEPMVTQLQQRLSGLGFKLAPDGRYGPVTEHAVKAFQRSLGLPETGEVDERTTETLRNPPMNADGTVRTTEQLRAEAKAAEKPKGKTKSGGSSSGGSSSGGSSSASDSGGDAERTVTYRGKERKVSAGEKLVPAGSRQREEDEIVVERDGKRFYVAADDLEAEGTGKGRSKGKGKGGSSGMIRRGDGMAGDADKGVTTTQQSLQDLGFDLGEGGVDGRFGEDTEKAVRAFQKRYGLRVDGVVGSQTQEWIKKLLKKKSDGDKAALGETHEEEIVSQLTARLEEAVAARQAATSGAEFTRAHAREVVAREKLDEATLTAKSRKKLPSSAFAIPPDKYPIHDEAHARNALARVAQHGSDEEKAKVRAAVKRRYPNIGLEEATMTLSPGSVSTRGRGGVAFAEKLHPRDRRGQFRDSPLAELKRMRSDILTRNKLGPRSEIRGDVLDKIEDEFKARGLKMNGEPHARPARTEKEIMDRALGPKLTAEADRKAAINAKPEGERTTAEKLSLLNVGAPAYGMRASVYRTGENEYEIREPRGDAARYGRMSYDAKPMKGTAEQVAAEIDRVAEDERAFRASQQRRSADASLLGGKNPFKGRPTLKLESVPSDWAVAHGYAEMSDMTEKGISFKGMRWKPDADPERVVVHYLGGVKPPENWAEGTKAHAQWTFPGKAKNKAERVALLKKITEAFQAREAGHLDHYVLLLNEVLAECAPEPEHVLEEVSSKTLPSLDRSPKKNWVDKAGGLPSYIDRIARHLHSEKGMTIGHAIATAVNVVKKMCAAGDVNFPGKQNVNPKSRAEACAAVASWEKKKAGAHMKEAVLLVEAAERTVPAKDRSMSMPEIDALVGEIEEAVYAEALHPRDRTGKWRDVPGSLRSSGIDRGGGDLASHLMGLGAGKHKIAVNGVPFTLYYDEQGAVGDSGSPVRGDKTGDWEVFKGHDEPLGRAVARVHVSPHGSSGHGNSAAPRYAAEQVSRAIMAEAQKKKPGALRSEGIDTRSGMRANAAALRAGADKQEAAFAGAGPPGSAESIARARSEADNLEALASRRATVLQKIQADKKPRRIDGTMVDVNTAGLLLQVFEQISPQNKMKFDSVPLMSLVDFGWKNARFRTG